MGSYQGKVYNTPEEAEEFVKTTVQAHPVVLFTKRFSPYCYKATSSFKSINVKYEEVLLSGRPDMQVIQDVLLKMTGARTVPRVFVHQKCIGGGNETSALHKQNKLKDLVDGKDASAVPPEETNQKEAEKKEDDAAEEQGKNDEEQKDAPDQQAEASPKHDADVEQESADAPAPEASETEPAQENQVEDKELVSPDQKEEVSAKPDDSEDVPLSQEQKDD